MDWANLRGVRGTRLRARRRVGQRGVRVRVPGAVARSRPLRDVRAARVRARRHLQRNQLRM
jgi:hypothetical protein